jgi:hypothetical protein
MLRTTDVNCILQTTDVNPPVDQYSYPSTMDRIVLKEPSCRGTAPCSCLLVWDPFLKLETVAPLFGIECF